MRKCDDNSSTAKCQLEVSEREVSEGVEWVREEKIFILNSFASQEVKFSYVEKASCLGRLSRMPSHFVTFVITTFLSVRVSRMCDMFTTAEEGENFTIFYFSGILLLVTIITFFLLCVQKIYKFKGKTGILGLLLETKKKVVALTHTHTNRDKFFTIVRTFFGFHKIFHIFFLFAHSPASNTRASEKRERKSWHVPRSHISSLKDFL
jgi:hypothetical protein